MLRVKAVDGEPTRFWVESNTLQCVNPQCAKQYSRLTRHQLIQGQKEPTDKLHIGDLCPACVRRHEDWAESCRIVVHSDSYTLAPQEKKDEVALLLKGREPKISTLDVRFHTVDIAAFHGNGQCGCEWFTMHHIPELNKLLPSEQAFGKHRCHHIRAAREFALDVALKVHEHERYANAGKQREEDQP